MQLAMLNWPGKRRLTLPSRAVHHIPRSDSIFWVESESASSCRDKLFFVIHFCIEFIEISDQIILFERQYRSNVCFIFAHDLLVESIPFFVERLPIRFVLLNHIDLFLRASHLQRFIEGKWVDFLQNCFECNQGLLQDFVPVVFRQINDNRNQHWESLFFICLQNVQEVIIFKEAHRSIGNLKVDTADTFNNSLEKFWDQTIYFVYFTYLKYLLKLCQEQSFFYTICKRPKFEQTFQQRYC